LRLEILGWHEARLLERVSEKADHLSPKVRLVLRVGHPRRNQGFEPGYPLLIDLGQVSVRARKPNEQVLHLAA
jgi:hypothetical protein